MRLQWMTIMALVLNHYCSVVKLTSIIHLKGKSNPPLGITEFSHDFPDCIFRFHDLPFLARRNITLSNLEHFKGRTECAVEFFNLPAGVIHVNVEKWANPVAYAKER